MPYLVDTSVLLRLANQADLQYAAARRAVTTLHAQDETLYIVPQVLVEFRNSATRPILNSGLGLSLQEEERKCDAFQVAFSFLPETPDIFPAWIALVRAAGVAGKQVHDARLAATCHVHAVTHVLTFNVRHFARFAAYGPSLTIVDPNSI